MSFRRRVNGLRSSLALGATAAAIAAAAATQAASEAPAPATCRMDTIGTVTVAAVRDGLTILLDDGREARLAAIEVPLPRSDDAGPSAQVARAALASLVTGRTLTLKRLGAAEDRYGRLLVHAFISTDGAEQSVQHALLIAGQARVAARVGEPACAMALLADERQARAAGRGLWADPAFRPRRADNPTDLLAEKGRFALVEGKVLSVRYSGGTIYMNFGRRWSQAFTITILKRDERIFTAAGLAPKALEGRVIRVRGTVEQRGGPRIEAARPEQIELAE